MNTEITNNQLAKSIEDMATTIDNLALITKKGFDDTATNFDFLTKRVEYIETNMATKTDLADLSADLTRTIFTEAGRLDRRSDQMALRDELHKLEERVDKIEKHIQ